MTARVFVLPSIWKKKRVGGGDGRTGRQAGVHAAHRAHEALLAASPRSSPDDALRQSWHGKKLVERIAERERLSTT